MRKHYCQSCLYNVSQTLADGIPRCPECGEIISENSCFHKSVYITLRPYIATCVAFMLIITAGLCGLSEPSEFRTPNNMIAVLAMCCTLGLTPISLFWLINIYMKRNYHASPDSSIIRAISTAVLTVLWWFLEFAAYFVVSGWFWR